MKHLKSFNESSWQNVMPSEQPDIWDQERLDELQDFCEMYLAYLIDNDFGVRVRNGSNTTRARIEFFKGTHFQPIPFSWDEVKEVYIPFFQILNKNYKISTMPDRRDAIDKNGTKWTGDIKEVSVKFNYLSAPDNAPWTASAKWVTADEIVNDEVLNLGITEYISVISIFL